MSVRILADRGLKILCLALETNLPEGSSVLPSATHGADGDPLHPANPNSRSLLVDLIRLSQVVPADWT